MFLPEETGDSINELNFRSYDSTTETNVMNYYQLMLRTIDSSLMVVRVKSQNSCSRIYRAEVESRTKLDSSDSRRFLTHSTAYDAIL